MSKDDPIFNLLHDNLGGTVLRSVLRELADKIAALGTDQLEQCVAESNKWATRAGRAERALERAGFTDEGGQEWKPPLGRAPVARLVADGTPDPSYDLVILDRVRCRDGMLLFDGAFHHEPSSTGRWDFLMRTLDNPEGPEAAMGQQVADELAAANPDDQRPESVQLAEIIDAARARLTQQTKENDNAA